MNDIEEFKYKIVLTVKAAAFTEEDARDMVEEMFGLGEECGIVILENSIKHVR